MQSTREKNIIMLFWATIVVLIGELSERTGSNVLLAAALALCVVYSLFCDTNCLLTFTLLLIAPNRVLTMGPISAPAIVMLIGSLRMASDGEIKVRTELLIAAAALMALSVFTYFNGYSQVFSSIKILIVLFFIKNYTDTSDIRKTHVKLVDACSIGCIITSLITMLINPTSIYENFRFSLTGSGGENVLGILCAVMALNLLCIVLNFKEKRTRYIVYIALLSMVSLLTGSRSAFVCLAGGMVGIFIATSFSRDFKRALVMLLFAGAVALIVYLSMRSSNIISTYIQRLIYRSQKRVNTDISNGRFELWRMYLGVFRRHIPILLFGGMNNSSYGLRLVAHNMIIEQVSAYGIIGSVLLVYLYLGVFRDVRIKSNARIRFFSVWSIPIIALLAVSMVSHTLLGIPQTMMMFLSAYGFLEVRK